MVGGIFWDMHSGYDHMVSSAANAAASSAKSAAARAESRAREMAGRAEKAMMICEALWIIMREKLDLDDDLLEKAVRAVDLQDGKLDGRVRRDVAECPKCKKKVGRGRIKCIWCGAELTGNVFG
jgi:hypothetical protein